MNIIHILCIKHTSGNHMHKYHWISWEGHNVGSTIGDSLLTSTTDHLLHTVTVQYLCSLLQKSQLNRLI